MYNLELSSAIERASAIYEDLLTNPSFERYEEKAGDIDQIFDYLRQQEFSHEERKKLENLKKLHDELISNILHEKASLGEQIAALDKKRRVTNQYGKISNYYGQDAFFIDYKK
ncbi:hypothetical protein NYE48_25600 [Paenibacillus sp. FSL M7-1455]|jgi:hypothetical protein|uniref:hypothetical protein n=1 Tax=Paenibacillus sp. FSL M7-1455 TaxID=2975316 RepID=UPI0030F6EC6D